MMLISIKQFSVWQRDAILHKESKSWWSIIVCCYTLIQFLDKSLFADDDLGKLLNCWSASFPPRLVLLLLVPTMPPWPPSSPSVEFGFGGFYWDCFGDFSDTAEMNILLFLVWSRDGKMGDACAVLELQGKAHHMVGWCLPWSTAHIYADGCVCCLFAARADTSPLGDRLWLGNISLSLVDSHKWKYLPPSTGHGWVFSYPM